MAKRQITRKDDDDDDDEEDKYKDKTAAPSPRRLPPSPKILMKINAPTGAALQPFFH